MKAKVFLFEGTECAGKTTQIKNIAKVLSDKGYKVAIEKEPDEEMKEIIFSEKIPEDLKYFFLTRMRFEKYFDMENKGFFDKYDVVLFDRGAVSTIIYQGEGVEFGSLTVAMSVVANEEQALNYYDCLFVDTTSYEEYLKRLSNRSDSENDEMDFQSEEEFNKIKNLYEHFNEINTKYLNLSESEKIETILKILERGKE